MQSMISVNKVVLKDEMKYKGTTLLTYQIEYPEFKSVNYQLSLAVINKYYKAKAMKYKKYCETELFRMAVEQYKGDIANNFPVRVFEAVLSDTVTYSAACVISLYFDQYEYTGGAHGNTVRSSQTWNLQSCTMIPLSKLFRCGIDYEAIILAFVEKEIEKNPDIYFENYKKLIRSTFHKKSFYCTPDSIVIYYQQYDIAPYSSGIREFAIPYTSHTACVTDPVKLCLTI